MTITRSDVFGALARAYCHDANADKEIDVELLDAMADEVMQVIEQAIIERETYRKP